jgi:O-antigen/teichoic acid export membrane protein
VVLRFVGIYSTEDKWGFVRGIVYYTSVLILVISIATTGLILFFSKDISVYIFQKIDLEPSLFWISISIPCVAVSTIIGMALQGLRRVFYSVAIQNIFIPIFLILLILIFHPHSASAMGFYYFVASFITLVVSIILWLMVVPNGPREFDTKLIIENCKPLWVVAILQQAIIYGGQFIAGIYCKPDILGQLAVAQRTSILISFMGIAVNLVSAPKFAAFYSQGKMLELKNYSINTTKVMILFATPLLLFIYMFPNVILLIFGRDFTGGAWMLKVLCTGQYINLITGSVGYLLMMSGHNKEFKNITIISGIISIILNLVLVNLYGGIGAAIAIALSVAIQNILALKMVEKKLGFNTLAIITLNLKNFNK